jgi:hypothetical protein
MPKLIIIVVGLVFAFIAYRKTWYPTWAFLFNVLISVYIGIMTMPQIVDKLPAIRNYLGNFSYSASILLGAAVIFAVTRLVTFKLFLSVYIVSFPKILNTAGSAVLGFLTGVVATGFLLFLITITPLSNFPVVKSFAQDRQAPDKINNVVLSSCNAVHDMSLQPDPTAIDKQIEKILTDWKKPVVKADSNSPANTISPLKYRFDQ